MMSRVGAVWGGEGTDCEGGERQSKNGATCNAVKPNTYQQLNESLVLQFGKVSQNIKQHPIPLLYPHLTLQNPLLSRLLLPVLLT